MQSISFQTTLHHLIRVSFFIAVALCLPLQSEAAATVEGSRNLTQEYEVVAISERHENGVAIFAIEFSLTAFGADMYLSPDVARAPGGNGIAYSILDGDKREVTKGISAAMLIPHEVVEEENMHRIEKDKTRRFTLLAAFAAAPNMHDEYLLKVSRLPLYNAEGNVQAELNPSEIEELRTDFIAI